MAYDKVIKICDMLELDYNSFEPRRNDESRLSSEERRLLAYYGCLSQRQRDKVIEYIKDIR